MKDLNLRREILGYALLRVNRVRLALVLANETCTYHYKAQQVLNIAQLDLPPLPIIIVAPRVQGYSRAYATFNIDEILPKLDVTQIAWSTHALKPRSRAVILPF